MGRTRFDDMCIVTRSTALAMGVADDAALWQPLDWKYLQFK
ncbi:MAG: hypothetical protein SVM79_05350 [Chloroflexota bacterium]|nr:hypothetical protein [Chloroflexota bacterium]